MRFFQPLLLSAMISAAMPLHAGPLDDPDHPLRPLELQLAELPSNVVSRAGRHLVLHRSRRQLLLIEQGRLLNRYPVAVGMTGWDTPAGTFRVLNKVSDPSWAHPQTGEVVTGEDPKNPLGSRWIGFYKDCFGRKGFDGERMLDIKGCTTAGFHGTPHRWTIGHAVSHGCVRLFDEDIRDLFDRVRTGTPVTILP
jgi:L,D-transpeptidase ErfK/SrfK